MAKAVWTGSLSFGLVNIPVRLYNATVPKDVRFHQFQRGTGRRIRYRRVSEGAEAASPWPDEATATEAPQVAPASVAPERAEPEEEMRPLQPRPSAEAEVPFEEVVKGFEIDRDQFVMVDPEELRVLEPERSQTIEIEGFVDLAEIDPVYFEKSYYVAPQRGVGAEKPYALLLQALQRANRVGIARFVMRTREYLAAIRPTDHIVVLETLFYSDEIRAAAEIDNVPGGTSVAERELAMAKQFIDLLAMAWDPSRYRDTYREKVLELIRALAESEGVITAEAAGPEAAVSPVPDLMAALRASVEAAKERRQQPAKKSRRRTG